MADELLLRIAEDIGEVKALCRGMIARQDLTNGRVLGLEEWRHAMEKSAAKAEGLQEGNADVLVSKKAATKLWAFAGVMATGTGTGAAWLWRHLS